MRQLAAGGPSVTAGSLIFEAAAYELIAYDAMTGEELWTGELPSMAETIPAIYEVDGRQYVAVSASEGK